MRAAVRISASMSRSLLLAAPSVPSARFTPASHEPCDRTPAARELEVGFGTVDDRHTMARELLDLLRLELRRVHGEEGRREQAELRESRDRPPSALCLARRDLVRTLVHVHVYGHLELIGELADLRERRVSDRIRCVRREAPRARAGRHGTHRGRRAPC